METLVINGIPLVAVVIALVEWIKGFGVSGNALKGVSMGVGVLLGAGYMIYNGGVPADFAGWFGYAIFGLALGLTASGLYDAAGSVLAQK